MNIFDLAMMKKIAGGSSSGGGSGGSKLYNHQISVTMWAGSSDEPTFPAVRMLMMCLNRSPDAINTPSAFMNVLYSIFLLQDPNNTIFMDETLETFYTVTGFTVVKSSTNADEHIINVFYSADGSNETWTFRTKNFNIFVDNDTVTEI